MGVIILQVYVLLLSVSCSSFVNGFQINNAGISRIGSIEDASLEGFDRIMKTNVRAVYHLTMLCVSHLVSTKGAIVNVSSLDGLRAVSFYLNIWWK